MIDRGKVIKGLEKISIKADLIPEELMSIEDAVVIDKAIELLKEKEAQSVLSNHVSESLPCRYVREGFCPKCHQAVEWLLNRNYCGFCGQAVKWDDPSI